MSDLTDRIAEVLRENPGPLFGADVDEWAAHSAERIAAELTEVLGVDALNKPIHRWVSDWEDVVSP